jgi:hypothetical protein
LIILIIVTYLKTPLLLPLEMVHKSCKFQCNHLELLIRLRIYLIWIILN